MFGNVATWERRALLVDALIHAAADAGYADLTPTLVSSYAGLAVEDFELEFESMDQCFLAALDRYVERLGDQMSDAWKPGGDWPVNVAEVVRAGLDFIMQLGGASRVFLIHHNGPAATELRMRSAERAAAALKAARVHYPQTAGYPEVMEKALVAGVVLVVRAQLLAEEPRLPQTLAEELIELILTPYVGSAAARGVAGDERTLVYM